MPEIPVHTLFACYAHVLFYIYLGPGSSALVAMIILFGIVIAYNLKKKDVRA